jgi:hypothetical protein
MTKTLRIATESRGDYYDLRNGLVRIAMGRYSENRARGGMERRYGLVGARTADADNNLQIMEAIKRIETFGKRAADYATDPTRTESIWLEEAAEGEAPIRRALITAIALRYSVNDLIDPLLGSGSLFGELVITTTPFHESIVASTLSASVSVLGGKLEIPGGGTTDGRVEQLSLRPAPSVAIRNAWVGIRPFNKGVSDFEPVTPFSSRTPTVTGVTIITDSGASSGQAVQVDHSVVSTPDTLTLRHWTSTGLAHVGKNGLHFYGRYRLILRYRIPNAATRAGTLIALKMYYGGQIPQAPGIPMDTVYLNGTEGAYTLIDLGEVSIPHYGIEAAKVVNFTSAQDTPFFFATEFIDGDPATDHLIVDSVVLVPSERLATLDEFNGGNGTEVFWVMSPMDNPSIVGQLLVQADGSSTLSLPEEGGVIVTVAERGDTNIAGVVTLTAVTRPRYGRYAGNG